MDARFLTSVGMGVGTRAGEHNSSQHPHWIKIDFPKKAPWIARCCFLGKVVQSKESPKSSSERVHNVFGVPEQMSSESVLHRCKTLSEA